MSRTIHSRCSLVLSALYTLGCPVHTFTENLLSFLPSISSTKKRCYNSNTLCCSAFSNCVKILFMWHWQVVPAIVGCGIRRRPVDRRMEDLRKCGDSVCLSVQLGLVVFNHFANYLSGFLLLS